MELFHEAEFWVAVAFVIAFGFLAWKAGPVVTKMLDDRAAKIKADLDEAARLRDEARRTLIDFQQKQRDAMKEADGIVAQARLEAERVAQQAERDLAASIERRQKQAVEKIALAETKALAEVRNQAVDVAIAAVRRILADDLGAARKSALIDAAIDDLSKRLN
ncbi:MAG TPA: F0F1 ATP synthase subunit B [Stellaceae bacterium]|nr:F0F1 ATP synthase subunit B [Stellaceae bacterium]